MRAIVNNCEDEQFTDEEINYQVLGQIKIKQGFGSIQGKGTLFRNIQNIGR